MQTWTPSAASTIKVRCNALNSELDCQILAFSSSLLAYSIAAKLSLGFTVRLVVALLLSFDLTTAYVSVSEPTIGSQHGQCY